MKIEPESDVLKIQHVLGGVCYLFHVPNYPVFYLKKKTKKQKNKKKTKMIHAPQYSVQHCVQEPRHGSSLNVHRGMDKKDMVQIHKGILPSH